MNERDGNGDVATLVANLRGMSFQYKLHVGELPDESEMVLLSDLADAGKAREVAQVFHAHYGTPRLRFAGSLSFQRCAHRLVGIVVGTWLLTGNVPVLAPGETALRITHGGATELHVASWNTVHGSAAPLSVCITYPRLWNRWWMPSVPEPEWGVPTFMAT